MPQTRFIGIAVLFACAIPLVHCGSSNGSGPPSLDAGAIDALADHTTPPSDAASSGDSTVDGGALGDAGDATTEDASLDAADGASVDSATDAGMDSDVDADAAPPPVLTCNQEICGPAQFCATVSLDAGTADDADADADAADSDAADAGPAISPLQCKGAVFSNVCDNPSGTVLVSAYDSDNAAAAIIGAALGSTCHIAIATPDAGGPVDPDSGEPTSGIGDLCIIAGGGSGQPAVRYLDQSLSDVILRGAYDDAGVFDLLFTEQNGPGAPQDLAVAPFASDPVTTDYFLIQLTVDPASGSLCMSVIGMSAQGTAAGAYFVANDFLANSAYQTSTKSWYVYSWTSGTDGGPPSSSDTFNPVASGP